MRLNLSDPASVIAAFVKTRASLEPVEVVTWLRGNIFSVVPGDSHWHLFGFEGHNIGWAQPTDDGFRWLSRECFFFLDPASGQILDLWKNPITGELNDVLQVWSDPVNQSFDVSGGPPTPTVTVMGDDVHFMTEVFDLYPNPLRSTSYRREVASDLFEGVELTRWMTTKTELEDDAASAGCLISSVRTTPYVPWMLMGDRPGNLVWHLGGQKLTGGYAELPSHLRAYVEANRPEFAYAPTSFVSPNETLWTLYGKERGPHR